MKNTPPSGHRQHRHHRLHQNPSGPPPPPADSAHSREGLQTAWSRLLRRFPWSHWATLEFAPHTPVKEPSRAFRLLQAWVDSLTRETQGPIPWIGTAEPYADDNLHLHVFLRGTSHLTIERLEHRWTQRHGSAAIRVYDPWQRAVEYSLKLLCSGEAAIDFSSGFVPAMSRLDAGIRSHLSTPVETA